MHPPTRYLLTSALQPLPSLSGKVFLEDAGFDWKILGPDVGDVPYVAWQSDQDAFACSGQKCSAQSILFMHENWRSTDLLGEKACFWYLVQFLNAVKSILHAIRHDHRREDQVKRRRQV